MEQMVGTDPTVSTMAGWCFTIKLHPHGAYIYLCHAVDVTLQIIFLYIKFNLNN